MNYNGQSQYSPYRQPGTPAYMQQLQQYASPHYQEQATQPQAQPHIGVVVPVRSPQPEYYQPPSQQQYYQQTRQPQYHQPASQPAYNYSHQYAPHPSPQFHSPQQQYQVNGHSSMQNPPSSPDPLQNGYHHPPQPRQAPQQVAAPSPPPQHEEPDYAILLLSLADEYFEAASKLKAPSEDYMQLIATALGCLESVLNNFNLDPLREAQISLRYGQVLYDETENYDDAEKVLTKAVEICQRNKFIDIKYSLQLLLAQVLYKSRPKAAIKDMQTLIEEIEAYQHTAWGYAFRYQLVMFWLSNATVRDLQQAIHHAEKLNQSASSNGDTAVVAFSAIIEAMLHLQTSSQDATNAAQRALATARSLQLDADVTSVPQLGFILELVDLCCSAREINLEQTDQKRKRMHEAFGVVIENKEWQASGPVVSLPLSNASLRGLPLQHGGLVQERGGRSVLQFSWLEIEEVEVVGFLLSAVTKTHKNTSERDKIQRFIDEGLNRTRELIKKAKKKITPGWEHRVNRLRLMELRYTVEQAFLHCSHGSWKAGRIAIEGATKMLDEIRDGIPKSVSCIVEYLKGAIEQGEGHLDAALDIYQSPGLSLAQFQRSTTNAGTSHPSRSDSETETRRNIAILAAMNTLLIINDPSHPSHSLRTAIIDALNSLTKTCTNKNILASYSLIHSLVTKSGIVISKNQLVSALNAAKAIHNAQITALVLLMMQQNFFKGQTDEHAVKCVKAASVQMRNWGDPMWGYVSAGIEAESLEAQGQAEQSRLKREEGRESLEHVPEKIRKRVEERGR